MPIILMLIEFSLAGFNGCMTGPRPPQELPRSATVARFESYLSNGNGSLEVSIWALNGWKVGIWSVDSEQRYTYVSGNLRRLIAECVEGGFDVDRDDDVDLRDWSVLIRQIAFCGPDRCYRQVGPL